MCLLIESIQVSDGKLIRLPFHEARMNNSRKQLFKSEDVIKLNKLDIPNICNKGKFKCRIIYKNEIKSIDFIPYEEKRFNDFVIEVIDFEYNHKFLNRESINHIRNKYPVTTEIIFTKRGKIYDSSFSNLIFKNRITKGWETPNTYLLNGTQRQFLLHQHKITEKSISVNKLCMYSHFMLINAMLDFRQERVYSIDVIKIS